MAQGLLIDYDWCSGCQSCELACRNEHGWELDTHGIKVLELGPYSMSGQKDKAIEWNYVPTPTALCDLCAGRVARGEVPTCQLHCLAGVITYGQIEELAKQAVSMTKGKLTLFVPENQTF